MRSLLPLSIAILCLILLSQSPLASAEAFDPRTHKLTNIPVGTVLRMEWGFYIPADRKEWGRTIEYNDTTVGCFLTPAHKTEGKEFDFMFAENMVVSKSQHRNRDTDIASNQQVQIHLRWENSETGENEYFGVIDCFLVNGPLNHSLTVQALQTVMPELWLKLPGATAPRKTLSNRDTNMDFAKADGLTAARRKK